MSQHAIVLLEDTKKVRLWIICVAVSLMLLLGSFGMVASAKSSQSFRSLEASVLFTEAGAVLHIACSVEDEEMLRAMVKEGAVINLLLNVSVEGHRSWWLNKSVTDESFVSSLSHHPLTREYIISLSHGVETTVLIDRNLTRLLQATWEKITVLLIPHEYLQELNPHREYIITVSAELVHAEVPPWLKNSMGLWSGEIIPPTTRNITITLPAITE